MFEGDGRQDLQSLIDSGSIMEESIRTPQYALDATGTTMKSEEHFWAFQDELLSDVRQLPSEGIHVLSTHVCILITQCKFPHPQMQEMLKIMVLQHAVWFYEARNRICQQDQSLLSQCKLLESWCEQYKKAKEYGQADLASITAVTSSASSIHANALTTQAPCNKCGYSHPPNKCPAKEQTCYTCISHNHYTALCK